MTQVWQAAQDPGTDLTTGFWGFVETVTARRVIDWGRVRREHSPLDPKAAGDSDPLADTLAKERSEMVHATLEKLPEGCRRLIRLHLREGMSYGEISGILSKSEGALRAQMYRCIRRARELLEELSDAPVPTRTSGGQGDRNP